MGRRWVRWSAAAVIALLCAAVLWAWSWTRSGLPLRSGEARLAGLAAPVEVRFDALGVPHVRAQSLRDLCAAVGWLQANDRMTQLELGRRSASGRLAEVAGPGALALDRHALELRLRRAAEGLWRACGAESRAALEGFADGVNAWLADRGGDLPPDLRILGARPEPWTPVDSLCFAALMARDLSYVRADDELHYAWLAAGREDALRELLDAPDLVVPEATARAAAGHDLDQPVDAAALRERDGSNNWALAAGRTASGQPLVASDPHLGLGLPSTWYQATLRAPGYEAAGFLLPGLPVVVIGMGPRVAWAFTNTEADVSDEFLEQVSEGGDAVLRPDGWLPVEVERVAVRVRGHREPVELELRSTDIGPLLPAVPEAFLPQRSLAWTLYADFDPLQAFLDLPRARDLAELRAALADFVCPVQNVAAADRDGGVLLALLGRLPDRGAGDGRLPVPAWEERYAWRGLRPQDENPLIAAPPSGVVASANDDWLPPGSPVPIPALFASSHRAERILERSQARSGWTAPEVAALQGDLVSLFALDVVAALPPPEAYASEAARAARQALAAWDGAMALEGPSALYALLERELRRAVFDDELRAWRLPRLPGHTSAPLLLRALTGGLPPRWLDDATTEPVETLADAAGAALERAWAAGRARWGDDVARWPYGEIHTWLAAHPLGGLPLLGDLLQRGPFPLPGSDTCIVAYTGPWIGAGVAVRHGPSMRWVSDLADPDRSLAGLPGGQSGHPFDRHYDDRLAPFLALRHEPVRFSEAAIEAAAVSRLRLLP